MSEFQNILDKLPYEPPFLFVDELLKVSSEGVEGTYTFKEDEWFYKGHFKGNPITPGVTLTECMAQIGLVCLGIFIASEEDTGNKKIALTNTTIDFYKGVLPGEKVRVISEREYFRFNKLKCKVNMTNEAGDVVAKGSISGMVVSLPSPRLRTGKSEQ